MHLHFQHCTPTPCAPLIRASGHLSTVCLILNLFNLQPPMRSVKNKKQNTNYHSPECCIYSTYRKRLKELTLLSSWKWNLLSVIFCVCEYEKKKERHRKALSGPGSNVLWPLWCMCVCSSVVSTCCVASMRNTTKGNTPPYYKEKVLSHNGHMM